MRALLFLLLLAAVMIFTGYIILPWYILPGEAASDV